MYNAERIQNSKQKLRTNMGHKKEVTGRAKSIDSSSSKRIVKDSIESYAQRQIANRFNNFFPEIGLKINSNMSAPGHFKKNSRNLLIAYSKEKQMIFAIPN